MADATDADAGEVALCAQVFIDTGGDKKIIFSATLAASDLIA